MRLRRVTAYDGRMSTYVQVEPLENEVEARLVSAILEEEGIPHFMRSYHDSAYDGIFQTHLGWGHIEAPAEHHERISELVRAFRDSSPGS